MIKIKDVFALDNGHISIYLTNDHAVLLNLHAMEGDPAYAALFRTNAWAKVKSDGESIYWDEGPRLGLEEVMQLLDNKV
ncbi:hypothetical protein LJC34_05960 [Oscillospiraceae bacterium OttesenSCG-928-G22]|nr:hypothetical protein [Oscillospiraceae bacterium OttesenSCG-928-G22]